MTPSANGSTPNPDHEVAIIGAGFSGIGAAIKVAEEGIEDFQVIEAGDGVGGAWHWNTYPGVAVDIPSPSYQFSFEQRSDWSRLYAPGDELKAYADDLADKLRHPLAHPLQHQGYERHLRRRCPLLAPRDRGRRRGHRALRDRGHGDLQRAAHS